jgi:hypothetical protein
MGSAILASGFVFLGFILAARPADEPLLWSWPIRDPAKGLLVSVILAVSGVGMCEHYCWQPNLAGRAGNHPGIGEMYSILHISKAVKSGTAMP